MIYRFFAENIVRIAIAIAAALVLWWLYSTITAKPKAEARLGRNTTEAAQQSGQDAVNTIGAAGEREAASDALTRSNDRDIRNAEGSSTIVAAPADKAGRAAVCRRLANRNDPACRVHH